MIDSTDIPLGTEVEVYWNLHRNRYSVRARAGESRGRVIAHVDEFHLDDAKFIVSEAGRQRVLAERRKNVHAVVRGFWGESKKGVILYHVRYDPYRWDCFVYASDKKPVYQAKPIAAHGIYFHKSGIQVVSAERPWPEAG